MGKMDWLVKQYADHSINYELEKTGEDYGTICVPTGGGKEGIIIRDIIRRIDNARHEDKIIFNLSAPLLNLCMQVDSDLCEVLKQTHADQWRNREFMMLVNSSADMSKYKAILDGENVKVEYFSEMNRALKENPTVRFIIVVSCNDSLVHFARKIKNLKKSWFIANYLDEAHTLVNFKNKRDYENNYDNLDADEKQRYDVMERLMDSECVYAFTATPHKMITALINNGLFDNKYKNDANHFIHQISARTLINMGYIVDVHPKFIIDEDKPLDAECAINFMDMCRQDNSLIPHKVLITCDSSEHLKHLEANLKQKGYTVFSTCAKHGISSNYHGEDKDSDDNFSDISAIEFTKMIDDYNDNCFVLHIRQLTAGIDIKTLTDCIICNGGSKIQDGTKMRIIQTIGRILRVLCGERPEELQKQGKTLDDRLKKYGNVLFRLKQGQEQKSIESQIAALIVDYYGLKSVLVFNHDPIGTEYGETGKHKGNKPDDEFTDAVYNLRLKAEEIMVNIKKYIEDKIIPTCDRLNKRGLIRGNFNLIENSVNNLMKQFSLGKYNSINDDSYAVREIISKDELMNAVTDLFKKYSIASK